MRVLFVTFPWKTHLFNFVPLAWALQTAGHEVRTASEPAITAAITQAGLTAVEVGSSETLQERGERIPAEEQPLRQPPPGPVDSLYTIGDRRERIAWEDLAWLDRNVVTPRTSFVNDTMVDDLVAYCRSWKPDLVLWDAVSQAGAVAAEVVGAAQGRILFSLDLSRRLRNDFLWAKERQPRDKREDGLRDWYTGWLEKYGCEFSEDLVTGHFTIDQMPESYRLETDERCVPLRHVPYNGPAVVPDWLYEPPTAPRVLMTFGITGRELPVEQAVPVERMREILDALGDLDIELVATVAADLHEEIGPVPGNTRIVDFVPLHAIIPSCSVLINHGGPGSFNSAMLHGVPQILVSITLDAAGKNALMEQTGTGIAVPPGEVTGARLREALVRLLDEPSFRANARRIQKEVLAQPTPNGLVAELERLAERYRRA
ncbi:DUF1205 domain-containing protein [Streptomyces albiaxialis]|uniref:DUF1205 domain-containing protein n=1 Tax=Streptomyces albiaxialis TaxID=329523 RepID=A0ABP5IL73_9ACTN